MTTKDRWSVAVFCTSSVLALHALALQSLSGLLNPYILFFGSVLTGTGLYVFLFRGASWLYDNVLWKYFHREYDINGDWILTYSSNTDNVHRRGVTHIRQSVHSIEVWGENYEDDGKLRSIWKATLALLNGHTLIFAFEGDRPGSDPKATAKRSGIVRVNLDGGKPPQQMVGMFHDTYPSASNGTVVFDRKK